MKNKLIYMILTAVLIVSIVSGCSAQAVSENNTTESATVSEESTVSNEITAVQTETESGVSNVDEDRQSPSATSGSGQKEETTTAKSAAKSTSPTKPKQGGTTTTNKKQTTTKRQTTTQKQTTTKKVTTTEAPYFCDEGGTHHSCDVGPIGWVDSFDTATDKALEYIGNHNASGNFRVKECFFCGKYTAYITLD